MVSEIDKIYSYIVFISFQPTEIMIFYFLVYEKKLFKHKQEINVQKNEFNSLVDSQEKTIGNRYFKTEKKTIKFYFLASININFIFRE